MATLHLRVWIAAPQERVYAALASAEGLGAWWTPHTATETADGLVLAHNPGPAHGEVQMKVLDSTPPRRVEWEIISTHPSASPASAWTGTRIVFELSTQASPGPWLGMDNPGQPMTVLDFRHEGWNEHSEFLGFCNYAWGLTLNRLRTHCETYEETA